MIRFHTGEEFASINNFAVETVIQGVQRQALKISIDAGHGYTYEQLHNLFVDGAQFSVVQQSEDKIETVFPKFEYIVAGPITDNRDGSFVVLMGALTKEEKLEAENALLLLELK